ncbi:MAG: sulfite exporter TauE/SafE family protein [Betaproteobacteria bacterium]|nr:sulfite exporter TauE/SafE family protein [Betaproteobacteria bacterium]
MLDTFEFGAVQVAVAAAVVFGAFIVRGMSGFGAGMVAIPLLVFVLPIHTAVPMMGLLAFVLFIFLTIRDRRDVVWDELKLLVPATILGVVAGALLFKNLDSVVLLRLLGAFIMGFALYVLAVHHFGLPQVRCSRRWAPPIGFVGAAVDTMFGGGGGTLVVVYMHMRGIGTAQFRATVAVLWFFEMIARLAGYAVSGYYTLSTLLFAALMLPLVWAGTHVGERIGNRISQETFSKVLAVMLLLCGVSVLLK